VMVVVVVAAVVIHTMVGAGQTGMVGLLTLILTCWGSGCCCSHSTGRDNHDGGSFHDPVNQMVKILKIK